MNEVKDTIGNPVNSDDRTEPFAVNDDLDGSVQPQINSVDDANKSTDLKPADDSRKPETENSDPVNIEEVDGLQSALNDSKADPYASKDETPDKKTTDEVSKSRKDSLEPSQPVADK